MDYDSEDTFKKDMMEIKFSKFIENLKNFFKLKKFSQTKVCWLIVEIDFTETPVRSTKISETRKAASSVILLHRPTLPWTVFVLFCPVKHLPNNQLSSACHTA